jgi:hypothetical protein
MLLSHGLRCFWDVGSTYNVTLSGSNRSSTLISGAPVNHGSHHIGRPAEGHRDSDGQVSVPRCSHLMQGQSSQKKIVIFESNLPLRIILIWPPRGWGACPVWNQPSTTLFSPRIGVVDVSNRVYILEHGPTYLSYPLPTAMNHQFLLNGLPFPKS